MARSCLFLFLGLGLSSACSDHRSLGEGETSSGDGSSSIGSSSSSAGTDGSSSSESTGQDAGEVGGGDDDTSTTGATSATSGFVPDAGENDCGKQCELWGDDCAEGEKCTLASCEVGGSAWDSFVCREVQGAAQRGEECMSIDGSSVSGNDTCAADLMCWGQDTDTGLGHCVAFCYGSSRSMPCAPGTVCVGGQVFGICVPGCDPLMQDCDGPNELCIPSVSEEGYTCVLDASGGMAPYGAPCAYANSCNPGLMCVETQFVPEASCGSSSGCCSPFCSIASGECPGQGQSCETIFDPPPPGLEDVGVCMAI